MITRYLVAVDLSEASLLALDTLKALSSTEPGDVTLLHVVDLDLYTAGGSVPGIMEFAEERLAAAVERLAGCGLHVSGTRVEQGDSADTILRVAAEVGADLVVMTNLGKGARTGRLFGSTAERVAASGSVPVLVERLSAEGPDDSCRLSVGSPFERTLVALDLEGDAEKLVRFVRSLPGRGAERLVYVARDAATAADARTRLDEILLAVPESDLIVESEIIVGEPAQAVLDLASSWGATAIVLAPCTHGALHRALWGSVARQVALDAPCSVLFVPLND